jgi:ABC-type multidrug transport system ATPase subunit
MCLNDAGKRFNRDWIFRHVDLELHAGQRYAITGHNGSGKSTLLQLIGGMITPSEGRRTLEQHGQPLDEDSSYREVSLCAPYLELIEEMTGMESLTFHQGFKPLRNGHTPASILEAVGLQKAAGKQVRFYSSGMKQRLKLAQAFFSDSALLLLDEPCTNLDKTGIALYQTLLASCTEGRIVIISSNDETEYEGADTILSMDVWKK